MRNKQAGQAVFLVLIVCGITAISAIEIFQNTVVRIKINQSQYEAPKMLHSNENGLLQAEEWLNKISGDTLLKEVSNKECLTKPCIIQAYPSDELIQKNISWWPKVTNKVATRFKLVHSLGEGYFIIEKLDIVKKNIADTAFLNEKIKKDVIYFRITAFINNTIDNSSRLMQIVVSREVEYIKPEDKVIILTTTPLQRESWVIK